MFITMCPVFLARNSLQAEMAVVGTALDFL